MAFEIICESWDEAKGIEHALNTHYLPKSRFNLGGTGQFGHAGGIHIESRATRKRPDRCAVLIRGVRLDRKKGYCGNHAGPCRVTGKKHRRHDFLEGADWVGFNDMLNDMLDSMHHPFDAGSTIVNIRMGGLRRVNYYGVDGGEFEKFGTAQDYEDHRGKTSRPSNLNEGTPGYNCWTPEAEAGLIAQEEQHVH